jgi:uncharacterized tellurite resistance protein B-like protein
MHIVVTLITLISFIAVWYWRLKTLHSVAKDGRKIVETVANLPRKMRFKSLSGRGGLNVVDDPREAATILMLEIAQARGTLSERQQAAVRGEIMHHFEFNETEANQLIAQSEWLSRNGGASQAVLSKMTDFVRKSPGMTNKELVDLDGMLVTVSEAEGDPTESQLKLLSLYRDKTGLRV